MSSNVKERLFQGDDRETLERALDTWGNDAQELHGVEELGELLTALMQYRRGRIDKPEVRDEIADVLIVANQFAILYGSDGVENQIEYKMARLNTRLDRYVDADTEREVEQ